MGYTLSAGALAGLAASCQKEIESSWEPTFFTAHQAQAIEELIEVMLPPTDSPGARELGVTPLVDIILNDVYKEKDQERFKKGMDVFMSQLGGAEQAAKSSFRKMTSALEASFSSMENDEAWEKLNAKKESELEEQEKEDYYHFRFIQSLRSLAISGYFSSELIGTKYLTYDPVPGPYQGCIPLSDVGNAYSL